MSRELILQTLAEHEHLTAAEIQQITGIQGETVRAQLNALARKLKTKPRRIHVAGWVHDAPGQRYYPRKLYALGDKPDKTKPPVDTLDRECLRYRNMVARSVTSVFDLGLKVRQRRTGARALNVGAA